MSLLGIIFNSSNFKFLVSIQISSRHDAEDAIDGLDGRKYDGRELSVQYARFDFFIIMDNWTCESRVCIDLSGTMILYPGTTALMSDVEDTEAAAEGEEGVGTGAGVGAAAGTGGEMD